MSSGRRPSACTSTTTGTGQRPASSGTASASPPDESRLGWMPCASSRSSRSAWFSIVMVLSSSVASCSSSVSRAALAASRSRMPSETRCCCAPSCRSRSMRRRASTPASTMRWRDWRTCSSVRSISERSRPLSTERRRALETPSSRRMLSVSTRSCRMSAIGAPRGDATGRMLWLPRGSARRPRRWARPRHPRTGPAPRPTSRPAPTRRAACGRATRPRGRGRRPRG